MTNNNITRVSNIDISCCQFGSLRVSRFGKLKVGRDQSTLDIETPTDATRCVSTEWDREQYIADFGDQELVYDARRDTYRVPAFKAIIDTYTAAKMRACDRYGCE